MGSMERSLVKQGPSTLMVSIPAKWLASHNLKKGDAVFLDETPQGIIISPRHRNKRSARTILDLSSQPILGNRSLRACYTEGFDEVELKFKSSSQFKDVQVRVLPELLGFSIVEQSADRALIRDLSRPSPDEFIPTFRRVFLLLISMQDLLIEAISDKNPHSFDEVFAVDQNINRNVNLCLRLMGKGLVPSDQDRKIALIILEVLGDYTKELSNSIKARPSKSLIKPIKDYQSFFKDLYELWFSFNIEKAESLSKEYQGLTLRLKSQNPKPTDLEPLIHLRKLADLSVVLVGLKLTNV